MQCMAMTDLCYSVPYEARGTQKHRNQDRSTVQILRQFGELSPDLIDMQRYAAWKAGDIRKALREGRTPTAGAPASAANAEQDLLDELGLPSVPGKHLLKGCTGR